MIALVKLPELRLPGGNVFNTLHGYWEPPDFVICFWTFGCKIPYISEEDYNIKREIVLKSHEECYRTYWRDNAL